MTDKLRRDVFREARPSLVERFGVDYLEETAYPSYYNRLPPARYLAWRRVSAAQTLLDGTDGAALDFGAGLGVMLPYLSKQFARVTACDLRIEATRFMLERLALENVEMAATLEEADGPYDAVVALDVLEHVPDLPAIYDRLAALTRPGGVWVISGPTENALYRAARFVARRPVEVTSEPSMTSSTTCQATSAVRLS